MSADAPAGPGVQVTFDAGDPERLGKFWAEVLGYIEQPPPAGFDTWDAFLASVGVPAEERDKAYAIVDPAGRRPRVYLQKVPEGKAAKNRVHLDVNVGAGLAGVDRRAAVRRRADELVALGAMELREEVDERFGEYCVVMQDIEGNEFCCQ
jgi:glyoxalase superfamily protein